MTTFPIPDDATIGPALEPFAPPTDAEILGGAVPGGVEIYGGADLAAFTDAHGYLYVVYCGERAGRKFGTHAFRVTPQGGLEWVELPAFTEGRAGVSLEPSGLWLTWPAPNGKSFSRYQVPGFVVPGFPSSGQTAPAPIPIPATPAPGSASGVDKEGREYTSKVKKELEAKIAELGSRIGQPAAGGLTASQVMDHIWAKAPDAIYARLQGNDPGLVGEIRRIVGSPPVSGPLPDRAQLTVLVREVLLELLRGR